MSKTRIRQKIPKNQLNFTINIFLYIRYPRSYASRNVIQNVYSSDWHNNNLN
uniref:Uncharacterized protein n=1 Tax=Rhizophagus irregularis (strain DAOM 181602 / DAOM 197198 / MUCL 43194) TaxID=747089 RepID=U9UNB0_RHIID